MKACVADLHSDSCEIDNKTNCGEDQRNKKDIDDYYRLLTPLPLAAHNEMERS